MRSRRSGLHAHLLFQSYSQLAGSILPEQQWPPHHGRHHRLRAGGYHVDSSIVYLAWRHMISPINPVERTTSQPTGRVAGGGVRGGWLAFAHFYRSA